MRFSLLIAFSLVVLASAAPERIRWQRLLDSNRDDDSIKTHSSAELDDEWNAFKINYGKSYIDAAEERLRKGIFAKHLRAIAINNYLYENGLKSYTMGINKFADLETSEFVSQMTGYIHRNMSDDSSSGSTYLSPEVSFTLPDEVDWRDKGYVTDVKDQGHCGSSWAFSATGLLEGQTFRKTGKLVSLSEQQLVDCSGHFGNAGCYAGVPAWALDYVKSAGGLDTEDSYPYYAKDGNCHYDPSKSGATCKGYQRIDENSEDELKEAVASLGPISVCIDATHQSFHLYKNGVYDEPDCSSTILGHCVLAVGYGTTKSGVDYWIVKNSWGTKWGMDGYILMSRNKDNQCGIATLAVFPLV